MGYHHNVEVQADEDRYDLVAKAWPELVEIMKHVKYNRRRQDFQKCCDVLESLKNLVLTGTVLTKFSSHLTDVRNS